MSRVPEVRFPGFSEEWRDVKLGDICEPPKYGLNAPATKFRTDLPAYLRITDITEDGRYIKENKVSVDIEDFYEYILKEGDLVFARTGATVGKTYLYKKEDGLLVYAGYLIKFSPKPNLAVARFIKFFTETPKYWKWVSIVSVRSGQPGINSQEYSSMRLFIPSLSEQQKIADFLTAVDEKIETVEAKIDRLERYKKGVMQKLLSGEVRFPGYTEEWREVRLGEVAKKILDKNKDQKINLVLTNSATEGIVPQRDYFDKDIANSTNLSVYYVVMPDDFVYNPRISKTAPVGPIGRNHSYIGVMSPLYTIFRFKKGNTNFFEYYFKTNHWHRYMKSIANYGARHDRMNIKDRDFFNMPIPFPALSEQQKIADFLTAIDDKIDTEKARLEALKAYKKGLLQKMFV